MRTTLDIEDDVLALARSLANARKISIGKAVSYLARRGAAARASLTTKNGFRVFSLDEKTPRFGPDDVSKALEIEDANDAAGFWQSGRPD